MNPFGTYLGVLRLRKRIKQKDLAVLLGITPSCMSELESGKRSPTSKELIQNIVQVMSLSAEESQTLQEYADQSIKVFHVPENLSLEGYSFVHQMRQALDTLSPDQFSALESLIVVLRNVGGENDVKNEK